MKKTKETIPQIQARARKKRLQQEKKDLAAKNKHREKEDKSIHSFSGKQLKDLTGGILNQGIKQGKLELLEKQLKEKEEQEAEPLTLADQLKKLEEKIKYARSRELEKIQDRKIISIINSVALQLEITLRSLIELERRGLNVYISKDDYEKKLEMGKSESRINSTTRKNLNFVAWAVEELKVCAALLLGGNSVEELPIELYPGGEKSHKKEIIRHLKLAAKRKKKAEAELQKQEKG